MDERVDVGVLVGAAAFKVDDDLLEGRVVIDSLYVSGTVRCGGGDHVCGVKGQPVWSHGEPDNR